MAEILSKSSILSNRYRRKSDFDTVYVSKVFWCEKCESMLRKCGLVEKPWKPYCIRNTTILKDSFMWKCVKVDISYHFHPHPMLFDTLQEEY